MARLAPSAFVILGLLDQHGPATPYRLDRWVAGSIGYFWSFPRSQLYAEAARLTRLGLVEERREETGRRRRLLSITDRGRGTLAAWRAETTSEPTRLVDAGLLRLYLSAPDDPEAVARLAASQRDAHRLRLREYERLVAAGHLPDGTAQRATLEMGLRFERLAVDFWSEVHGTGP